MPFPGVLYLSYLYLEQPLTEEVLTWPRHRQRLRCFVPMLMRMKPGCGS